MTPDTEFYIEELAVAVGALAQLRKIAADQKAEASLLEERIAQFDESKALFLIQEARAETMARMSGADELVRNLAVELYLNTDDKKPHPAVPIKMYTILEYDKPVAFRYIRESLPVALKADWPLFEKIAKTVGGRLGFVIESQEPRATIARNLSKWEPKEEEEDATV